MQGKGSVCHTQTWKKMSLVVHHGKILRSVSPFCAKQRHQVSCEHSEGWEQAACARNEDGHIRRFYWNQPASFHAFTIPNVTHPSISISFPRISSAIALAMSSNRAKTQTRGIVSQ